ncbi:MAG: DUF4293 domain-containing protein [Flavobacteriales bacterium]
MIQRKQSLFLALAALCIGLMFFFPIATYDLPDQTEQVVFGMLGTTVGGQPALFAPNPIVPLHILGGIGIALLVGVIFLFKQRMRQVRFVNLGYMLLLGLFAAVFMSEHSMQELMDRKGGAPGSYGLSYFLPLVALVLVFLAVRAIKADEALVKSADRLR